MTAKFSTDNKEKKMTANIQGWYPFVLFNEIQIEKKIIEVLSC